MFRANIKKLPVVSHRNRLIGIVTLTDMARLQPYLLKVLKQLNSRTHLLTDTEKELITKYLDAGQKLAGFKVTLHRCRHMQTVQNDLELISEFLAKVKTEKKPRASRQLLTGLH
jgi:CBS-domain-containing membrane protein